MIAWGSFALGFLSAHVLYAGLAVGAFLWLTRTPRERTPIRLERRRVARES